MQVADGNGQSVGGIRRIRWGCKAEQARDHMLHLDFIGFPVPDNC
jgi:hypothetical protein